MKKFLACMLILLLLVSAFGCKPAEEESESEGALLKIVSYNVRGIDDGPNKMVSDRAPRLKEVLSKRGADIMGFQEVKPAWETYLKEYFSAEYDHLLIYRDERGDMSEAAPIFWKKARFEKKDGGIFWLSDTPDKMSKGWDAEYYRCCTWVRLKDKLSGKEFLFFNTHMDTAKEANQKSGALILKRMKALGAFQKYPAFLIGDFNTRPWKGGYVELMEGLLLGDVNADLDNLRRGTNNGYHEKDSANVIDFCLYSNETAEAVKYELIDEEVLGGYVSDHLGVYAEVRFL